MAETETMSAEEQIKHAIWQWTGWAIMILLTFLAGVAVAWLFWGDAPRLKAEISDLNAKVLQARKDREETLYKLSRAERDNEKLQNQLQSQSGAPSQ